MVVVGYPLSVICLGRVRGGGPPSHVNSFTCTDIISITASYRDNSTVEIGRSYNYSGWMSVQGVCVVVAPLSLQTTAPGSLMSLGFDARCRRFHCQTIEGIEERW